MDFIASFYTSIYKKTRSAVTVLPSGIKLGMVQYTVSAKRLDFSWWERWEFRGYVQGMKNSHVLTLLSIALHNLDKPSSYFKARLI